ncbi:hypothetical protein COU80_01945 [Candidatus Peregrinibacteria bacterium CG10_big_fil_rev_8_21_14_0_10_55_24]|nr:MAG: hypothetical protein COU80_01945 [Candidatus Peregrinibacteria bacterium CG10_big_fil_rev_8_21_14_0_10_55_24]
MSAQTRSTRSIIGLLFVTSFLELLGLGIAIPVFAPMLLHPAHGLILNISTEARTILYGFLIATYPLTQFFGTPILGALSDHYGRKPLLILSRAGTLVSYIITAIAISIGNIPLLFISRAVDGFTGGNIAVAQSAIADVSTGKDRLKNFGLIGMAFGLGFIVGPLLGGVLSDPHIYPAFSFATPFWVAAVITAINIAIVQWKLPETLRERHTVNVHPLQGFVNVVHALRQPRLRVLFLVFFLYVLGFNFFTQFFQVLLVGRFHFDQSDIGLLYAYMGLWITFAQGVTNRLCAHWFLPRNTLTVSLLLLGCTIPLLLIPQHAIYLYLIFPFIANFQGISMPSVTALISDTAPPGRQGATLGTSQSFQALGMALPGIAAGLLGALDVRLPIFAAGALVVAAWMLYVTGWWRKN